MHSRYGPCPQPLFGHHLMLAKTRGGFLPADPFGCSMLRPSELTTEGPVAGTVPNPPAGVGEHTPFAVQKSPWHRHRCGQDRPRGSTYHYYLEGARVKFSAQLFFSRRVSFVRICAHFSRPAQRQLRDKRTPSDMIWCCADHLRIVASAARTSLRACSSVRSSRAFGPRRSPLATYR